MKKEKKRGQLEQSLAIAVLIVNLILPGLGTLIAGNTKKGVIQLVLAIAGYFLIGWALIGIPLVVVAEIWALITSVNYIINAKK